MIIKDGKRIDGLGDSMPIGSIVEIAGMEIPDGWEEVFEPEDATVYIGPKPTDGQDIWIQRGKNLIRTPYTSSNKLTITATQDDHYIHTDYGCYLEEGKTYTVSFESDGEAGGTAGTDTVQLWLLKDNEYTYKYAFSSKQLSFTPEASGTYYLRFDVNKNGSTHTFWNIQIERGATSSTYEKYIERKMHTRNEDGEYLKFYNEPRVGDIYITSSNKSPSSALGGAWELVGKDFINAYGKNDASFTPSDMVTAYTIQFERNNSTIRIRMNLTVKEGITDSDCSLGRLDLTSFGCANFQYNIFNHTALFDTGNTIVSLYIGGDGSVITKDVIVRGSSSASAPAIQGYVDFQIPVRDVNKLDDYCDKFYWKRTS
jgi:hypothetical protein